MSDDTPTGIWVTSDVLPDGTYGLTVQYTDDVAVSFDRATATAYAREVFDAATAAAYDAAVVDQFNQLSNDTNAERRVAATGHVVHQLRATRPPLDQDALGILALTPGVSAYTGRPFLHCSLLGHPLRWQWSPADAEQHATQVMQGVAVAHLDGVYRRFLVEEIGLDEGTARATVGDLAKWRGKT